MIKYFIISPDGFSTFPEPFECSEKEFETHSDKKMEEFIMRFKQQGYYSSNNGRILLEDLKEHLTIRKEA